MVNIIKLPKLKHVARSGCAALCAVTLTIEAARAQTAAPQCDPYRGPPRLADMPDALYDLRLGYRASRQAQTCQDAVEALRAVWEDGDESLLPRVYWANAATGAVPDHLAEVIAYVDACTSAVPPTESASKFEKHLTDAAGRLTVFFKPDLGGGMTPHCAGFRVSEGRVTTAKHCFAQKERWSNLIKPEEQEASSIPMKRPNGGVAMVMGDIVQIFEYELQDSEFYAWSADQMEDQTIVTLSGEHFAQDDPFPTLSVQQYDKIGFVNFFPTASAARYVAAKLGGENPAQVPSISDLVRFDLTPNCYAMDVEKGCVFYNCQTVAGLSGSPVLSWERRIPTATGPKLGFGLSAVHNRHIPERNVCAAPCGFTRAHAYRNVGARLNDTLLSLGVPVQGAPDGGSVAPQSDQ